MDATTRSDQETTDPILAALRRHWGYDALRPLQREAIEAGLSGRDSLVVMPTGGGKSLCYQLPPLLADRLDVVVSPLLALMKDQVDALRANGYPAAALNSAMDAQERRAVRSLLDAGGVRLLFLSPERLAGAGMLDALARLGVSSFAIDEAHCISHWGHDFRPEYRRLRAIRERLPEASLHAFTATATPEVREDIVRELDLRDPLLLVGDFHRPNLIYRVLPKHGRAASEQVRDVLARHAGEAGIVYCISRARTAELASALRGWKIRAAAYHAGLSPEERRRVQDAFSREELDVVVATVAFGMGIDRSDVRCVVHEALPRSIEAYQQESGRAGRDGLPAECVLLYSYSDVARWESLLERSHDEAVAALRDEAAAGPGGADGDDAAPIAAGLSDRVAALEAHLEAQRAHLRRVARLCSGARCRHAALCEHFGQRWTRDGCGACDVCLGEIETLAEGTTVARKILSAVARTGGRFGAQHVARVLVGSEDAAVRRVGHDQLSVHGLLRDHPQVQVVDFVHQLVDHGLLARSGGDYPTLGLTAAGVEAMRGEREVRLRAPATKKARRRPTALEANSWESVDRMLFDRLRELRRRLALERGVPPYVVFDDTTLRALSRVRPGTLDAMASIRGIGRKKLDSFGSLFLAEIDSHCAEHGLARDVEG